MHFYEAGKLLGAQTVIDKVIDGQFRIKINRNEVVITFKLHAVAAIIKDDVFAFTGFGAFTGFCGLLEKFFEVVPRRHPIAIVPLCDLVAKTGQLALDSVDIVGGVAKRGHMRIGSVAEQERKAPRWRLLGF